MDRGKGEAVSETRPWFYDTKRRRWAKCYVDGSVAAVVHQAQTPGEQRATGPGGWIVSVYRRGKGEGRIAVTGNAPSETEGCRIADAVLGAIAEEQS